MPCLLRQTDYRRGTSRQYACDNKANQERQSLHTQTEDKRNGKHNSQMDSGYIDARYRFTKSQYWRIDDADVVTVGPWRVKERTLGSDLRW